VDIWKENILEYLKERLLEYKITGGFLANIKKEFERKDEKNDKNGRVEETRVRK